MRFSADGMPTRCSISMARSAAALLIELHVGADALGELVLDGEDGVQARHRLLEDHRDVVAADVAHLALGEREQVPALEDDLAAPRRARAAAAVPSPKARRRSCPSPIRPRWPGPRPRARRSSCRPTAWTVPLFSLEVGARGPFTSRSVFASDGCRGGSRDARRCGGSVVMACPYLTRDLGSSASRRPSPSRLKASTVG